MRNRMRVACAVVLSLAFSVSAPHAKSVGACTTPEVVTEEIRRSMPDAEIRTVVGALASRLRNGISALVGEQVAEGGSYLIARMPHALTSYVVRFADGCATHHGRFPDRLLRIWMEGSPA